MLYLVIGIGAQVHEYLEGGLHVIRDVQGVGDLLDGVADGWIAP
ncbi:hypothetical protein [Candidatus Magnetobacterium casense]|nr:hypothetical protein [Candidatus Magnetobacterium casensis]